MRILLDECLPRRLKADLVGHDTRTAPEMGWAGKKNGELLALASRQFDAFLTVDRNLSFQQNVDKLEIAVVVLVARSNKARIFNLSSPTFRGFWLHLRRGRLSEWVPDDSGAG